MRHVEGFFKRARTLPQVSGAGKRSLIASHKPIQDRSSRCGNACRRYFERQNLEIYEGLGMSERQKPQQRALSLQKQRAERLAAELRANLKKRKSAARAPDHADATGANVLEIPGGDTPS